MGRIVATRRQVALVASHGPRGQRFDAARCHRGTHTEEHYRKRLWEVCAWERGCGRGGIKWIAVSVALSTEVGRQRVMANSVAEGRWRGSAEAPAGRLKSAFRQLNTVAP